MCVNDSDVVPGAGVPLAVLQLAARSHPDREMRVLEGVFVEVSYTITMREYHDSLELSASCPPSPSPN